MEDAAEPATGAPEDAPSQGPAAAAAEEAGAAPEHVPSQASAGVQSRFFLGRLDDGMHVASAH
eukprot:7813709-Pyramimonas_sp.AAC.1